MNFAIEPMRLEDWEAVRGIYLEGIATGHVTFETEAPSWEAWNQGHLTVGRLVARGDGQVLGWASLSPVSQRGCYAGVAEVSIYVGAAARQQGVGRVLMQAVIAASEQAGIWTLQGSCFPENLASLALQKAFGFREVGRREKIARLHGLWRDTVLMERRSPNFV